MKIYNRIETLNITEPAVITIGSFDGVHLAHQDILLRVKKEAEKIKGQSVVVSFSPHPRKVLEPDFAMSLLTVEQEKNHLIELQGIDHLLYIHFTKEFSQLSYLDFIDLLLTKINIKTIVMGYNNNFGNKREGKREKITDLCQRKAIDVVEVKQKMIGGQIISSSAIRRALLEGKVTLANHLLGYHYSLSLAVDTVEQECSCGVLNSAEKVIPQQGIYKIKIDGNSCSMTITDNDKVKVEADLRPATTYPIIFIKEV